MLIASDGPFSRNSQSRDPITPTRGQGQVFRRQLRSHPLAACSKGLRQMRSIETSILPRRVFLHGFQAVQGFSMDEFQSGFTEKLLILIVGHTEDPWLVP